MTLWEVADEIARRLCRIFLRGEHGTRPVYGGSEKFQRDPYWRDLILFYEYFHGDNGAGIGRQSSDGLDRISCLVNQVASDLGSRRGAPERL